MRFYEKQPLLVCNLLLLFISLLNMIFMPMGFEAFEYPLFTAMLMFLLLLLILHIMVLIFLEMLLVGKQQKQTLKTLIGWTGLKLFYKKFVILCKTERAVLVFNLLWVILAIIYFIIKLNFDYNSYSRGLLCVRNTAFYVFKIQFFFSCATFLFGYAYKFLIKPQTV